MNIAEKPVAIIGLGYVGLPLARAFVTAGMQVVGFDVDKKKIETLRVGQSYIKSLSHDDIGDMLGGGLFRVTANILELAECGAILICVPTPLGQNREPDLSFVVQTVESVAPHLHDEQLLVLESTTYPGTTSQVMKDILVSCGKIEGTDFHLAYSPEREDPGNPNFSTSQIPKVVGADTPKGLELAVSVYERIVPKVVTVSSSQAAEAVKLTENIFRSVNIALVNELKVVYDAMGIDVWEVIEAAKTKPFGFMPFYPGPGLGGHCIPIDPFYLTWKAREFGISTRFIELAGEVNTSMPNYVLKKLAEGLDRELQRGFYGSKILIIGIAYKRNVDDPRESPAFVLMEKLSERGALIDYYDPFIPVIPPLREHPEFVGNKSVSWDPETLSGYDAALICTDHDGVSYEALLSSCPVVVDTRNALSGLSGSRAKIIRA